MSQPPISISITGGTDAVNGRTRAQGKTVVAVLHDLNQASRYCDHLVVMANGHIMAQGTPEAVMNPRIAENRIQCGYGNTPRTSIW